ncbi:MAG: glycosyltransferase family A protein, partial [Nanoarchaeota archaeon]
MISFIIPAYQEEKYIERTLRSIPDNFEKIVVCNGCSDQTYNIAKKYAEVINISEKNVSKARNLGAKIAKNNLLVFLDADTRLSRDAFNDLIKLKDKN